MKRQRLLFSLLMAIVMMAFSPTGAWAQSSEPQVPTNPIELKLGVNNVNVPELPWQDWASDYYNSAYYVMCTYKVKADSKVAFKIQCTGDMTTVLYDSQMQKLDFSFFASNTNEYAIDDAKAGDVYYVGVRGYYENNINPCTITVEVNVPECAPGEHELTPYEGVPATCTTAGTKAYYECSKCEHRYADAECTEEITDLTIPALGHDLDAEGKCQREGCDYALSLSLLVAGDNNVVIGNPTSSNEWDSDPKNPEHYTMFKYTVKADGNVTIKGVGDLDTYGVLYDAGMNYIKASDDDNGRNFMFSIQDAKAGDVYYIGARGYGENVIGDYIICVEANVPECAPGEHELTLHEGVAATCTTAGKKAYYECSKCEKSFADAAGTEEITDLTIPALGHDLDADGNCQREGCDEHMDIIALHSGVNNVNVPELPWEDWASDYLNSAYYVMCMYKVKADGKVAFKIQCTGDMTTVLYDSKMQNLYYTFAASNTNEYAIDDAKAGDVYYVGVRGYYESNINPCTITVETNVPECAPGEHELTPHEGVAATCTTAGTKAYYECSKCEHRYTDAAGTEEITDVIIPALGHDLDADGKCQREGCDVKMVVKVLKPGDNNVVIENPTTGEEWTDDRENPEHYTLFKYTVKADGDITFRSVGGDDTYCVLYDSSMEYLDCSDGNEENGYMDFVLVRNNVKAGEVYYLGVRGYGDDVIGDYIIRVEAIFPPCAPGEHELTPHEGVAATCTTAGNKDYYECGKCEHRYVDAEGTEEITDVIIPALGHDLDADGKCQREGCDYLNLLVAGDNNVVIGNPTLSDGDWWLDWDRRDGSHLAPRHYILFKLVAEEDNDITIRSVGDEDTYGVLYDADMNYIRYSDDGEDSNFKLSILDAKAGEVYYVGARWYDDQDPAAYTINVTYGPVEDDPDDPVGPVDISGTITVGDTSVDISDGDEVYNFNSENEGKMSMEIAVVEDLPHFVLKLNNAEITAGAIDDGGAVGIDYFGNVPLIINLTGKNSIKFSDVTGTAMGVCTESELMFTGTGSLDINCADGTAPVFVGIAAEDLITYSQKFADNISSSPMGLSFNGSININGKTQMAALGLLANDYLMLTSGEFNINTESALQVMTAGMIVKAGEIGLMNTKVKINSNLAGIAFAAPEDEEPDAEPAALVAKKLMPKKSSRKAKAGKKKINVIGTPAYDLFVSGADVEIDAAVAAIVNARQNPSCVIGPASTPGGVAHIAAGTSKETAVDQVINGDIDIFAEAADKNYLHIYETGEAIMNVHLYDTEAARDEYFETTEGLDGCPSYYALFAANTPYLNVTLHRTFQDDGWYTLCLPFDLEVAGSPFSKAARFAGVDISGVQFSLGFNTVDKMIAGIPYLVKVDHTVQNPEFKNIKLNYVKPGYEAYDVSIDTFTDTYTFNGSFDPVETFGGYFAGVGAGNMVNAINNGTKIRGFRGFFTAPKPYVDLIGGGNGGDGPIVIGAKKITFTVDGANEGAATDIDPDVIVNRNAGDGKTYNVMGQRVNKNAKGLIIRNGRAILKK